MADLKINQLDPIIYVSSGSGASFSALSDADLFIVKMKVRGVAIGDEDRKLTWLELRNSLNLGQYMPTIGGNFTGDITMNNNKGVKAQQTGSGADVSLIVLDSSNRTNVGSTTNLTRIQSSSIPQFIDGTGTYTFITSKNLPVPGDINAYTKAEVENKLDTKFDKTGGSVSGDINLTQNASRLYGYTTDGLKASLAYVTAGNTVDYGHSTLHTNIVSTDVPSWTNGSQSYDIITRGNLPVPGDIGAYTKAQVDTALGLKLDLAGGNLSGSLTFANGQGLIGRDMQSTNRGVFVPTGTSLLVGDIAGFALKLRSSTTPTVQVGNTTEYQIYHQGNKPTTADLGLTDTVAKAATALQDGAFGLGTSTPHKADAGFLSINDSTFFFVQDGSSTEQRFGSLGAGLHMNYGKVGTGTSAQYRSASLFVDQNNKLISKWSSLDYAGNLIGTQTATYFSDMNPPTSAQVGSYSKSESDGLYARKGVNSDITALNGLTGALKVGADGTDDLHVPTMRQLRIATGATAGSIVGVVGGFVGAVMWFNGPRDRVPAGWLPADGQLLKRTDAPDLWNAVRNGSYAQTTEALWQNSGEGSDASQQSNATNRGKYSLGDGSTTFRLPDLNGGQSGTITNAYLRGFGTGGDQSTIGKMHLDGAPNITGGFVTRVPGGHADYVKGAFTGSNGSDISSTTRAATYDGSGTGQSIDNSNYGYKLDASRSFSGYGRSTTEIRPRSAVGIWIIRVSNNFEAANTQFSVNNGAATLPASGTMTAGGSLLSVYSVNGVQDHAVTLSSQRSVGGASYANLTVTQQAQGSVPFKSANYTFGTDGAFTAGSMWSNGSIRGTSVTATAGLSVTGGATVTGDTNAQRVLASWINSSGDTVVGLNNSTSAGTLYVHGQEYVLKTNQYKLANDANGYQTNGFRVANQINSLACDYQLYENRGSYHEASFHLYGANSDNWFKMRSNGQLYWASNRDGSFTMQYPTQSVQIASDGNVSGSAWGGWLRDYINARVSDRRTKENIQEITLEDAQKFVENAKTYQWDYKTNGTKGHGMIADEVDADKKFNTGSNKSLDLEDVEAIDEGQLALAYLTPVIADLMKQVAELKAQVAELKAANK